MTPLTIHGEVGRIDWGYYTAAALTKFRVAQVKTAWRLDGICLELDAFNLQQRPLVFVVPTQHGEWRWPVVHVEAPRERGGLLHARLGAPLNGVRHA